MKKRLNFWDILAWIAFAIIVIWLILKTFGVINTPLWLEYTPIYAAVYLAGRAIHKLDNVAEDVRDLRKFKNETIDQINDLKMNCVKNHLR